MNNPKPNNGINRLLANSVEHAHINYSGRHETKSKFALKHAERAKEHMKNAGATISDFRELLHDENLAKQARKTIKKASQFLIGRRFSNRA